ncbi:hypothetical protein glysoja_044856 [Glycine soja]|uniref:Uncharacterized protein n=1 Tax=Glycine soja TaxID=3848 RepID=A0A0B2SPM3_GLYSO|nr:hypothetical protein glysoja_044856 [Glycine soja]
MVSQARKKHVDGEVAVADHCILNLQIRSWKLAFSFPRAEGGGSNRRNQSASRGVGREGGSKMESGDCSQRQAHHQHGSQEPFQCTNQTGRQKGSLPPPPPAPCLHRRRSVFWIRCGVGYGRREWRVLRENRNRKPCNVPVHGH